MWLCPSINAGITVLPVRSTRVAFAGGCRSPFLPTQVKEFPSTRNAEFSITGLLSPAIRRAPSNHVAVRRAWPRDTAARSARQMLTRCNDIVPPVGRILAANYANYANGVF